MVVVLAAAGHSVPVAAGHTLSRAVAGDHGPERVADAERGPAGGRRHQRAVDVDVGRRAVAKPVVAPKVAAVKPPRIVDKRPRPQPKLDFRRPRIKAGDLSPGERKIAQDWIWGDPLQNRSD